MAESDLYRKGIALRSELMGEAFAASMNSTSARIFTMPTQSRE